MTYNVSMGTLNPTIPYHTTIVKALLVPASLVKWGYNKYLGFIFIMAYVHGNVLNWFESYLTDRQQQCLI